MIISYLYFPGDGKQRLDQLLSLSQPLAGETAAGDVDEVAAGLAGQGPGQQGLAIACNIATLLRRQWRQDNNEPFTWRSKQ